MDFISLTPISEGSIRTFSLQIDRPDVNGIAYILGPWPCNDCQAEGVGLGLGFKLDIKLIRHGFHGLLGYYIRVVNSQGCPLLRAIQDVIS